MDKKQFNKITKEIFLEYDFVKQKDNYILYLDEITIIVKFRSWRGVKSFNYWFFLNDLYDDSVKLIEIKMEHNTELRGYHRHEILFEEWTEEEYRELLNKMLHSYFDPYRGVIVSVKVDTGKIKVKDKIKMMETDSTFEVVELGVNTPKSVKRSCKNCK